MKNSSSNHLEKNPEKIKEVKEKEVKEKKVKEKDIKGTLKTLIPAVIIIAVLSVFFMITGNKKLNVNLKEFEMYEQEGIQVMAMSVEVADSAGYIRTLDLKEEGDSLYVTFYSTFGFNSDMGSSSTFPVEIKSEYEKVYFYDSAAEGEFTQVLEKNAETGEWEIK